jgi:hypothetical protein
MKRRSNRQKEELRMFENRLYPLHEVGSAHPQHKKQLAQMMLEDRVYSDAHTLNKNLLGRLLLNARVPDIILPRIGETSHLEYVKRFLRNRGKLRHPTESRLFHREPSILAVHRSADGGEIIMKHSDHHGEFKPAFFWRFDSTGKITHAEAIGD